MDNGEVIDHMKVALRDGSPSPDAEAARALIERLTREELSNAANERDVNWPLPDNEDDWSFGREILRRDLVKILNDLGTDGSVEYEAVGWSEMPEETAHVHRLRATGVLGAAGLVVYAPVVTWTPW
jgi:hypothetical protein